MDGQVLQLNIPWFNPKLNDGFLSPPPAGYSPQVLELAWQVVERAAKSIDKKGKVTVTLRNSRVGALKAASGVFVGSLLLGPVGLLVGGAIGVGYAYSTAENFEGLLPMVLSLPQPEKDELLSKFLVEVQRESKNIDNLTQFLQGLLQAEGIARAAKFLQDALKITPT